jgi:hypothetical protein
MKKFLHGLLILWLTVVFAIPAEGRSLVSAGERPNPAGV